MSARARTAGLAVLAAALSFPASALAITDRDLRHLGTTQPSGSGPTHVSFSSGGTLLRTVLGLAVVVAVILVLAKLLRTSQSRRMRVGGSGPVTVLSTTPLGPNRNLHLIRVGAEVILIGAGEGGITPLRTFDEDEALSIGAIGLEDVGGDEPLAGALRRSGSPPAPQTSARRTIVDALRDLTTR